MVKGFIEKVVKTDYLFKVRIPTYHRIQNTPGATPTEDLPDAPVCTTPGVNPHYQVGDIVWCEFENDEIGHPVIVGLLYREEGSESTSDIQADSIIANVNAEFPEETKIGEVSQSIQALPQIQQQVIDGISQLQDDKVSKSGDTMTGILISNRSVDDGSAYIIKHNAPKGEVPSARQDKYVSFMDNSETAKNLGVIISEVSTGGYVYLANNAYSLLGDGYASLRVRVDPDGTGHSQFYQSADSILGINASGPHELLHAGNYGSYALPLSGGTLTGQLVQSSNESAPIRIKHTFAKGSNPSSTEYRNIYFNDSGSTANYLAAIQTWVGNNGNSVAQISSHQNSSGTGVSGVRMSVTQDGYTYLWAVVNSNTYEIKHSNNMKFASNSVTHKASSADYEYTGLSVSGGTYGTDVYFVISWTSQQPVGYILSSSSTSVANNVIRYKYEPSSYGGPFTPMFHIPPSATWYLWDKRSAAATAANTFTAYYRTL